MIHRYKKKGATYSTGKVHFAPAPISSYGFKLARIKIKEAAVYSGMEARICK